MREIDFAHWAENAFLTLNQHKNHKIETIQFVVLVQGQRSVFNIWRKFRSTGHLSWKKIKFFLHFFHTISNFSRFSPKYLKLLSAFKMEELQNFKPKDLESETWCFTTFGTKSQLFIRASVNSLSAFLPLRTSDRNWKTCSQKSKL